MPSSSSVYTRLTPEMQHDFDPASSVPPLFAERQANDPHTSKYHFDRSSGVTTINESSLSMSSYADHERQREAAKSNFSNGLRKPWQGASGETGLLTPIASTQANGGSSRSMSPINDNGSENYPSPQSISDGYRSEHSLHPPPDFTTPIQQQSEWSDGASIGYDVSPWSTPDTRRKTSGSSKYYGSVIDGTPGRTPSRRGRSNFSSPAYKRQQQPRHLSTATKTTDGAYTVFEESEPPTTGQPAHVVTNEGGAVHFKRDAVPVTPPMQQQGYRPLATAVQDFGSSDEISARASHFSWTTQGTETVYPDPDSTPDRDAVPPSAKFFDSAESSPPAAPTQQNSLQGLLRTLPPQRSEHERQSSTNNTPTIEAPPPSSIMDRRRPISTSPHLDSEREHPALARKPNETKPYIRRKPAPSSATRLSTTPELIDHLGVQNHSRSNGHSRTPSSTEKALPTTPAELSTHDYITTLDAQLETLSHRKHNLLKLIERHENVVFGPDVNPMVIDLQQRRETKEKVRLMREELSEIRREEHEVGLRLVKAQRRRDQEAPSALWVRRIAS